MKQFFLFAFYFTFTFWCHSQNEELSRALELLSSDKQEAFAIVQAQIKDPKVSASDKSLAFYISADIKKKDDLLGSFWDYMEALRFLELSGEENIGRRAGLYTNLGRAYHKYNDFARAVDYYKKALEISPKDIKKHIYYNIALSQSKMGNDTLALQTLIEGLAYCEDDVNQRAKIYSKMGTILADARSFDKSIEYQFKIINDPDVSERYIGRAYHNLGIAYTLQGDTASAIDSFKNAVEIKNGSDKFLSLQDLAEILMQSGNYASSIEVGKKAESYYDQIEEIPSSFAIFEILAKAYYRIGDYHNHYIYMEKFTDAADRFNENRRNVLEQGDMQYIVTLTEKYEKEISLQKQQAINHLLIMFGSVSLTILLLLIAGMKLSWWIKKRAIEKDMKSIVSRE